MTQLLKVQNLVVSSDGYAAGEGQSLERPFGHADPGEMMAWAGATASWPNRTDPGGSRGLDDHLVRDFHRNIGAEIMGRNKFGPQRGPWPDESWTGWWGEEPPFHTPVFVMTHHPRPSFTLGDTTFHFVDADPATVLEQAREAAEGKDVRLGGGAHTIRQFLDAGLVDTLHVAVSPSSSAPAAASGTPPTTSSTATTATSSPARAASSTTCSGATEGRRCPGLIAPHHVQAAIGPAAARPVATCVTSPPMTGRLLDRVAR